MGDKSAAHDGLLFVISNLQRLGHLDQWSADTARSFVESMSNDLAESRASEASLRQQVSELTERLHGYHVREAQALGLTPPWRQASCPACIALAATAERQGDASQAGEGV